MNILSFVKNSYLYAKYSIAIGSGAGAAAMIGYGIYSAIPAWYISGAIFTVESIILFVDSGIAAQIKAEVDKLSAEIVKMTSEVDKLSGENTKLQKNNEMFSQQLDDQFLLINKQKEINATAEKNNATLSDENDRYSEQLDEMTKQLTDMFSNNSQLKLIIAETEKISVDLSKAKEELTVKISDLETQNATLAKTSSELTVDLDKLRIMYKNSIELATNLATGTQLLEKYSMNIHRDSDKLENTAQIMEVLAEKLKKRAFTDMDKNHDGLISIAEFTAAIEEMVRSSASFYESTPAVRAENA